MRELELIARTPPASPDSPRQLAPSALAPPSIERLATALTRRLHAAGFIVTIDGEVEAAGAAELLELAPKTLRNWRAEDFGPRSRTVRGNAWYSIRGLANWLTEEQRAGRHVLAIDLEAAHPAAVAIERKE